MSQKTLREPIAPIRWIRLFLNSPVYIALMAGIVAYGCVFGTEMFTFLCYMIAVILTMLFAEDTAPTAALWAFGYITFSHSNNPGMFTEGEETVASVYTPDFIRKFVAIIAVIAVCAFIMIVRCLRSHGKRSPGHLLPGYLLLGVSFLLGGLNTPYYSGKTVLFGLLEIVCLGIVYSFMLHTVKRETLPKNLYGWIFTFMGLALLAETVGMYYAIDFNFEDRFMRDYLFTGWGNYNNVAGMAIMCVPAPFFLMVQRKRIIPYGLCALLILTGVFLTQSRNGILVGSLIFLISAVCAFVYSDKTRRVIFAVFALLVIGVLGFGVYHYWDILEEKLRFVYDAMLNKGWDLNGRSDIWASGWGHFKDSPIFGNGFYRADTFLWGNLPEGSFLPPRYHNTVIQLLASGGYVALGAYLIHRLQTVIMFLRRDRSRTAFIFLSILALCLSSMADNFFFNFGPGLPYGLLLFFLETEEKRKKKV